LKSSSLLALLSLLVVLPAVPAAAAQNEPEYDMGRMQMLLLMKTGRSLAADESTWVHRAHRAYVDTLMSRGQLAFSGIAAGQDSLFEVLVVKADSLPDAEKLVSGLPTVTSGVVAPRYLTWYAARNFLTLPRKPLQRTPYIFGILKRGPKWTAETNETTKKLQEGHMANITRLHEAGKLALAGPFVDGGVNRGVFIFKVPTVEEAQALTDTDPAVKAGRLYIELHPVQVPAGVLP
jgi:uncharacterized protein YciI